MASKPSSTEPKQRLRWPSQMARPSEEGAAWSSDRVELRGLDLAEHVLLVQRSDAWQRLMSPVCRQVDKQRSRCGRKFLYTTEELELVLLFGRAAGKTSYKDTRDLLAGDRSASRRLLGLDHARNASSGRVTKLRDGVPSEATMSRHKRRFAEKTRVEIWVEIEKQIRKEHLETPELQAELGQLQLDGSSLRTHYRCPVKNKKRSGMKNVPVTCADGGYVGRTAGPDKAGHGWNLVLISTSSQDPLNWALVPLNESEMNTALEMVKGDFKNETAPYLSARGDKIAALTADGAFKKPELRAALRRLGVLENIHLASHADKSEARASKMTEQRFPIHGYANWKANGHREVICRCGRRAAKTITKNDRGEVIARVQGKCPTCGSVSITSGDWRFTKKSGFVRCKTTDSDKRRDWALGNGLTFRDPVAAVLGKSRFSRQEGLFSALTTRFHLLDQKRWFRRMDQAKIEVAMTLTLIHALALEQRRRAREARAGDPPGDLRLAA